MFDIVHAVLPGAGNARGYHHESLANSVVVRIILRYIAGQRSIFDDPERRARLVSILGLLSDVGRSDALKLMYELSDLLIGDVQCLGKRMRNDRFGGHKDVSCLFCRSLLASPAGWRNDRDGRHESILRLPSWSLDHVWQNISAPIRARHAKP